MTRPATSANAEIPKRRNGRKNANGEGSIYQRKSDGRWVGQAYVLTTQGVEKRKFVYAATWEEAHAKLVELKARSQRGIPIPDRTWTVGSYLGYWLRVYAAEKKPTTATSYESVVRLYLIPALGTKRLDRLQPAHVRSLLDACRAKCLCCLNGGDRHRPAVRQCCSVGRCCAKTPSVRQVQLVHAVLRNALEHAMREDLVPRNVAKLVRVPAPRYKVGKGLSIDQVKSLLRASSDHRLAALYVVAATMGLRRGELLGLRWADIDLTRGTLEVAQTVQRAGGALHVQAAKTEASESILPLPDISRRALEAHRTRQDGERAQLAEVWAEHGLVFPAEGGTPMEPRNLNRNFSIMRVRAGLDDVRLHDLRHTVVSLLMELGTPPHVVQAIARHADVNITLRIYAHSNLSAMRDALGRLDGQLS
jgi:integrase